MKRAEHLTAMDHEALAEMAAEQAGHITAMTEIIVKQRLALHRRRQEVAVLRTRLDLPMDSQCAAAMATDKPKRSRSTEKKHRCREREAVSA